MKISTGQEYAAKIINTKKLSARGEYMLCNVAPVAACLSGTVTSLKTVTFLALSALKPTSSSCFD